MEQENNALENLQKKQITHLPHPSPNYCIPCLYPRKIQFYFYITFIGIIGFAR
jgi:hypothetical protein